MGGSGAEDNVEILFHGENDWKEGMVTCIHNFQCLFTYDKG